MEERVIIEGVYRNVSLKKLLKILFFSGLAFGAAYAIGSFGVLGIFDSRSVVVHVIEALLVCAGFAFGLPLLVFLAFWLFYLPIYLTIRKSRITVTNMRVTGTAIFGKRVDLPLDMISAVGTSWLGGIDVATSSGAIKFKLIQNKTEVHKAISDLLLQRQQKPAAQAAAPQVSASAADELKKFKDLLDSGVISEEEFAAKKKQLLGL